MKLKIYLFAGLSEMFHQDELVLDIDQGSITAAQLKESIGERYPQLRTLVQQAYIAKNQTYAAPDEHIAENDEIALIPPVSGGQERASGDDVNLTVENGNGELYEITYNPLNIEEVTRKVIHPGHGASIAFVGTTREYTKGKRTVLLEYDAYVPMALRTLHQIGEEISSKWKETLTAISHRLGPVHIGETSVVIAVSSPHREACYEASRYAIERLKQIVPIWKKEIWEDGSEWKGHQLGPWDPTVPLYSEK